MGVGRHLGGAGLLIGLLLRMAVLVVGVWLAYASSRSLGLRDKVDDVAVRSQLSTSGWLGLVVGILIVLVSIVGFFVRSGLHHRAGY